MIKEIYQTRCAWCNAFLDGDVMAIKISHGICKECKKKILEQNKLYRLKESKNDN